MSRPGRLGLVVVTLLVLHFFLHVGMGIGGAAPDFLTVALLLAAREIEIGWASGLGLVFGLLQDALSVFSFGANTIAMTLVGALGAVTRGLFVGDSRLFVLSYFLLGKWMRDLIHWIAVGEELRRPFAEQVLAQGLIGGLYAAVIGMALVALTGLWGEV